MSTVKQSKPATPAEPVTEEASPPPSVLDPALVTFLLDRPMARAVVCNMMRNAATTRDDPKMVEWYRPVSEATPSAAREAEWAALLKRTIR